MYRPYVKNEKGCHPVEYYDAALIDLVKNLKEQLELHKEIADNQLKESRNDFLALESEESEILSYIHNNQYHEYKEPIYSKEGN